MLNEDDTSHYIVWIVVQLTACRVVVITITVIFSYIMRGWSNASRECTLICSTSNNIQRKVESYNTTCSELGIDVYVSIHMLQGILQQSYQVYLGESDSEARDQLLTLFIMVDAS